MQVSYDDEPVIKQLEPCSSKNILDNWFYTGKKFYCKECYWPLSEHPFLKIKKILEKDF